MARGYAAVGLHSPKDALNIGSALRAAGCYDAAFVAVQGARVPAMRMRAPTDTRKTWRHKPLLRVSDLREALPFDCVPVAVDLLDGAQRLPDFKHPERAFYVFGPEDGTLGRSVTDWCACSVMVPTLTCMNLAAAVNVVLYDRLAKQKEVE